MTLIEQNKIHWQMGKDLANRAMGPKNSHLASEKIIKTFKGKLLDWGCGVGRFYPLFKKYQIEYYGIDIMPELLRYFKEDNPDVLNLQTIDGFKTKFKKEFLIIWCLTFFNHCEGEDVANILKEWKRILKDDGVIYCSVIFGVQNFTDVHLIYFNKEYFLGLVEKAGFNYEQVLKVYEIEDTYQTLFKLKKK